MAILPVREFRDDQFVVMVTKQGTIKKTELSQFSHVRRDGIIAISIDQGDELCSAKLSSGKHHVFICSRLGMSIRFNEEEVRPMGRSARGVKAFELDEGDIVVGVEVLDPVDRQNTILTVTDGGFGKRTEPEEYRSQSRGGKGIITMRTSEKTGVVMGTKAVTDKDDLIVITNKGQTIRLHVREIRETGRVAQGVRLIDLNGSEKVVGIELLADKEEDDANANDGAPSENSPASNPIH
jgi:DNA gyrase subunit A